jgi:hypothetical protein
VRCAECGFDWTQAPEDTIEIIRESPSRVMASLAGVGAVIRRRPEPLRWSALEYAAHLADAMDWYAERLERMHGDDRPRFSAFDWDAACDDRRYNERHLDDVSRFLAASAARCVGALESSARVGWSGEAIGSDGTTRSSASQALRAAHEVEHHLYDIASGLRGAP